MWLAVVSEPWDRNLSLDSGVDGRWLKCCPLCHLYCVCSPFSARGEMWGLVLPGLLQWTKRWVKESEGGGKGREKEGILRVSLLILWKLWEFKDTGSQKRSGGRTKESTTLLLWLSMGAPTCLEGVTQSVAEQGVLALSSLHHPYPWWEGSF